MTLPWRWPLTSTERTASFRGRAPTRPWPIFLQCWPSTRITAYGGYVRPVDLTEGVRFKQLSCPYIMICSCIAAQLTRVFFSTCSFNNTRILNVYGQVLHCCHLAVCQKFEGHLCMVKIFFRAGYEVQNRHTKGVNRGRQNSNVWQGT